MRPNLRATIAIAICLTILVGCGIAANGEPGVGIDYIVNNGDGTFTMFLTDESSYTVGNFTGPQGPQGPQGEIGPAGPGFDTLAYDIVPADGSLSSSSYIDLPGAYPVDVTITSGKALVILTAYIEILAPPSEAQAWMSFRVSGATTRSASDEWALTVRWLGTYAGGNGAMASAVYVAEGLNNGVNSFCLQYKTSVNQYVYFEDYSIIVIPLP